MDHNAIEQAKSILRAYVKFIAENKIGVPETCAKITGEYAIKYVTFNNIFTANSQTLESRLEKGNIGNVESLRYTESKLTDLKSKLQAFIDAAGFEFFDSKGNVIANIIASDEKTLTQDGRLQVRKILRDEENGTEKEKVNVPPIYTVLFFEKKHHYKELNLTVDREYNFSLCPDEDKLWDCMTNWSGSSLTLTLSKKVSSTDRLNFTYANCDFNSLLMLGVFSGVYGGHGICGNTVMFKKAVENKDIYIASQFFLADSFNITLKSAVSLDLINNKNYNGSLVGFEGDYEGWFINPSKSTFENLQMKISKNGEVHIALAVDNLTKYRGYATKLLNKRILVVKYDYREVELQDYRALIAFDTNTFNEENQTMFGIFGGIERDMSSPFAARIAIKKVESSKKVELFLWDIKNPRLYSKMIARLEAERLSKFFLGEEHVEFTSLAVILRHGIQRELNF